MYIMQGIRNSEYDFKTSVINGKYEIYLWNVAKLWLILTVFKQRY